MKELQVEVDVGAWLHEHVESFQLDHIENTVVGVNMSNDSALIIDSVYIPSGNQLLVDDLDSLFAANNKIIVVGDMNSWVNIAKGRVLIEHADAHGYVVAAPTEPTYYGNGRGDVLDVFCLKKRVWRIFIDGNEF